MIMRLNVKIEKIVPRVCATLRKPQSSPEIQNSKQLIFDTCSITYMKNVFSQLTRTYREIS